MEIVRRLDALTPGPPVVATIGNFDGVHTGHQYLIGLVKARAAALGARGVVITFDPHPRMVLRPDQPFAQLTCLSDKIKLIGALGVDQLIILAFTPQMAAQTPDEFMERLTEHLRLRHLIEGADFALGRARAGNPAVLSKIGERLGYTVEVVERVATDGQEVSSDAIRQYLNAGDVAAAARLLGHWPSATGSVVEGHKRGRTIGFPTANLAVSQGQLLPANGVYAAVASSVELPHAYRAMVNIGTRPTFGAGERSIEAHLLDFNGDLYGMSLTLRFVAHLRAERKFDGIEALAAQLQRDQAATREAVTASLLSGTEWLGEPVPAR